MKIFPGHAAKWKGDPGKAGKGGNRISISFLDSETQSEEEGKKQEYPRLHRTAP